MPVFFKVLARCGFVGVGNAEIQACATRKGYSPVFEGPGVVVALSISRSTLIKLKKKG